MYTYMDVTNQELPDVSIRWRGAEKRFLKIKDRYFWVLTDKVVNLAPYFQMVVDLGLCRPMVTTVFESDPLGYPLGYNPETGESNMALVAIMSYEADEGFDTALTDLLKNLNETF